MQSNFHLYIHAPWCKRHCPYCDFTVYVDRNPAFKQWQQKIIRDWNWHKSHLRIDQEPNTIYIGGGTPSLVPTTHLSTIISDIKGPSTKEITLEVNPGDVHPKLLDSYKMLGINRLSLGIQTLNRHHLRTLGRASTPSDANQLIQWVKQAEFESWSVDLMFGLPNQTLEELSEDIEQLLLFDPPHISIYGLTYKPGTPFYNARSRGQLQDIDEDLWIQMFTHIENTMKESGYIRYEVSNFCKPPHTSQHNEGVWKNEPYIGLGPSAHGFWFDKSRTHFSTSWTTWLSQSEPLIESSSSEQQAIDWLLTAIRHYQGIYLPTLHSMGFHIDTNTNIFEQIKPYIIADDVRIRLASSGWIVVNWITDKLLEILNPNDKESL